MVVTKEDLKKLESKLRLIWKGLDDIRATLFLSMLDIKEMENALKTKKET